MVRRCTQPSKESGSLMVLGVGRGYTMMVTRLLGSLPRLRRLIEQPGAHSYSQGQTAIELDCSLPVVQLPEP